MDLGSLNPIEWLQKLFTDAAGEVASGCFSLLQTFLIEPTDFMKFDVVGIAFNIVYNLSLAFSSLFFVYNLIKLVLQKMYGNNSRSVSEITVKTVLGTFMASFAPLIITNVLIYINNGIVKMIIAQGVSVKTFSLLIAAPVKMGVAGGFIILLIAIGFVFLTFQYIVRLAEIMLLYIMAPMAAISMVNEDMNTFSTWYWEAFSTIFTQSIQLLMLWVATSLLTNLESGTRGMKEVLLSGGLMYLIIKGPKWLNKFLYRTNVARIPVNAANSMSSAYNHGLIARKIVRKVVTR